MKNSNIRNRPDGRADNTLRPLTCELHCLVSCDGSCLFKAGGTHVLAAVHGPIAPRLMSDEQQKQMIQVIIKSGSTAQGTLEREWEGLLSRILTHCCILPPDRSICSLTLQIVSADGSVLSTALHAAVSALMDAGVELRTLPTAVTCLLPHGHLEGDKAAAIRLDPCQTEEQRDDAGVLVLVLEGEKLLATHSSTDLQQNVETILQCCKVAEKASQAIRAFWRLAVESKVQRESKTLWSS